MKTIWMILFGLAMQIPTQLLAQAPEYQAGWIYLKVKDSSSVVLDPYVGNIPALNTLLTLYGNDTLYHPFKTQHPILDKIYKLKIADTLGINTMLAGLQALSFVDYAERVPLYRTGGVTFQPNDLQGSQWHLPQINAPGAWDIATGSPTVKVAVIDNAFKLTHEDLAASVYINPGEIPGNFFDDDLNGYIDDVNGWDAADFDGNPNPPSGASDTTGWIHGTHCAGIAAATTNNGVGIASIGYGVKFIPIKAALNISNGNGITNSDEGIDYAMRIGADVLSMSFGGTGTSLTTQHLLQVAEWSGITLIAAAGNSNDSSQFYPAAFNTVLAVGSTNPQDQKSGFSNFGSWVDVMAPGSNIYSTLIGNNASYGSLSGTSMACPLVAGLAGLTLSANPGMSPTDLKNAIKAGCENIDAQNPAIIGQIGSGRINARNTLLLVSAEMPTEEGQTMQVWPNPSTHLVVVRIEGEIPALGQGSLSLYQTQGKLVRSQQVNLSEREWMLDVSTLPQGTYHLTLQTDNTYYSQHIQVFH